MKAKEFRDQTQAELEKRLSECESDLMNFRLQVTTGVVDNVRRARETRRNIARIKTVLRERELAGAPVKGN